MLCLATRLLSSLSILFSTVLSYSVLFCSTLLCSALNFFDLCISVLISLLQSSQWLEFMAAPLLQLVDNHEDLEPSDGISVFEMPPLGTGFTEEVSGNSIIFIL
jgi:hypothetical protein